MLASNVSIITSPKLITADFFRLFISWEQTPALVTGGTVVITNTNTPVSTLTTTISTTWLTLTVRQSQFVRVVLFIDGTDVSQYLVGRLEVHWPDDGNGQCTFSLVTRNPFADSPPFNIESDVDVFALYTDPDDGSS